MYNDFSEVYDRLIDADYSKFVSYYNKIFDRFLGKKPELLLDLGCGTGSLTSLLKKDGYDMIGVDASYDMLMRAREKDPDILYLNQDMTDFELYGTVGAAVSSLDCINYLLEDGELLRVFELVNNYLDPNGIFVFDISSYYKLSEILGNNTLVYEENDVFYAWENCFEDGFLDMRLNFFEKQGTLYKRIVEEQTQRAYSEDEIFSAARQAGGPQVGVGAAGLDPKKRRGGQTKGRCPTPATRSRPISDSRHRTNWSRRPKSRAACTPTWWHSSSSSRPRRFCPAPWS